MAIQKLDNRWGAVFNKGDAAAVVAIYIEDAHVLPAGALMAPGPDDSQKFWAAMQQLYDVNWTAVDVKTPRARLSTRDWHPHLQNKGRDAVG